MVINHITSHKFSIPFYSKALSIINVRCFT
nr:MAG TPA: hypothetical protein [Caudoviricetes sp.]